MNCKKFSLVANVSLEASIRTAKYLLWWRVGELRNVFSGGGKLNCKMFALVVNRRTAKCLLWWRVGELQKFSGGVKVNCNMFSLVASK